MEAQEKYKKLCDYLKNMESVAVAFSGGTDSTLLLKAAADALRDKAISITIVSPYIPKWEVAEAIQLAKEFGVNHMMIEVPIIDAIKNNPNDRCYLCKKSIFTQIIDEATKKGIKYVIDGTNADDLMDYRPGLKALKELKVKSPLLENGFTKQDIREMSNYLNLHTWNKPAYACLLSRIPYDTEIKEEELSKIEMAENYLRSRGFEAVRVRCHGDIARIEVNRSERSKLFNEELLDEISLKLKQFGFQYVTIDAYGYKMGSLNGDLKNKE